MSFDEVFERRTRQERDITVQQNERAAGISQNLFGGQECMGRPKLWFLHHKSEPAVPQERLFHLRRLIPDDDGRRLRFECGGGRQDVFDERQARGLDPFNQVSLFELSAYLRHMLLRDADVFSMAHGLEVRVPLLDHRLVELVAQMPGSFKQRDARPKPLLLDAVGPRLPALAWARGKQGFTFPWDGWLRGPLRQRATLAI